MAQTPQTPIMVANRHKSGTYVHAATAHLIDGKQKAPAQSAEWPPNPGTAKTEKSQSPVFCVQFALFLRAPANTNAVEDKASGQTNKQGNNRRHAGQQGKTPISIMAEPTTCAPPKPQKMAERMAPDTFWGVAPARSKTAITPRQIRRYGEYAAHHKADKSRQWRGGPIKKPRKSDSPTLSQS